MGPGEEPSRDQELGGGRQELGGFEDRMPRALLGSWGRGTLDLGSKPLPTPRKTLYFQNSGTSRVIYVNPQLYLWET